MSFDPPMHDWSAPERFVVEVFSELDESTLQRRSRAVNAILRAAMLAGLQMQLDATLNLLCDFAGEIAPSDRCLIYFWDEEKDTAHMRVMRGLEDFPLEASEGGNILNMWAMKYGRPLLVSAGHNHHADTFLSSVHSESALVIPLIANQKVMGSLQLLCATANAFSQEDAQLLWILALVSETQLTRDYTNDGLIRFAFTDYLTGLKTRGFFEQQLELELKRAERKKSNIALLMIDIDFFKQLNDQYGHHVGDQVLRDVASILVKDMREVDTVARYGGEEFVIVLPDTSSPGAALVADRVRRSVERSNFFAGTPRAVEHLTISIGVALYPTDAQFKRDLIEFSDAALYAAKSQGRNRVVLYADLMARRREVS